MTRPHVTVHSMASADGRTDHFSGDVGLYYELAAGFPQDAVLTGSGTLVAAAAEQGVTLDGEDPPPDAPDGAGDRDGSGAPHAAAEVGATGETGDGAAGEAGDADGAGQAPPLLVVVDGGGRLTRFAWLRRMPYWRDIVVLCAASTPASHLELLDRHRIGHIVTGAERVDLAAALTALAEGYGVRRVRVDSGGTLNGVLLRAGLVDDISVLLGPYAVGGRSARGLFVADDLPHDGDGAVTPLELRAVERLRGDVVWLRYRVRRPEA